jgi:C-terminal processing protease CtpA/Prc
VAAALQDHGRAIIMGTRSYGKGSVQTIPERHDVDLLVDVVRELIQIRLH